MPQPARLISCDEAGFTGPELLNEDQPYFVYASVDLSPPEAQALIDQTRADHRVQAPELKSKVLRKRPNWPNIAGDIARAIDRRALVLSFDKRLILAGKAFEYLFEPVLEQNSKLFYGLNLHRFVMNALHRSMLESGKGLDQLAIELQAFMRSFDPATAPSIFAPRAPREEASLVLDCILRFARGYSSRIETKTAHLRAGENPLGKWALDLTSAALFSLIMRGWGHRYRSIDLLCDDSKPLRDAAPFFDNFVGRADSTEISDGRRNVEIQANLSRPIVFGSSADHPTLQIADIVAGMTSDVLKNPDDDRFVWLSSWVSRHHHEDNVHPDDRHIDTSAIEPRINLAILRELASRADRGADPLSGMEDVYAAAYKRFRSPASRLRRTAPMIKRSSATRRDD